MKSIHLISIVFLLVAPILVVGQDIRINEIMSSNPTSIYDEDGDFSDWMEIFNPSDAAVDLTGYELSDNKKKPFKWVFPSFSIPAGGYLVVWASGKNRMSQITSLHTSFGMSKDGEEIVLTGPDGKMVDKILPVKLPSDISFGRSLSNPENFGYFSIPTPGQQNNQTSYESILSPPDFSCNGGFYANEFYLTISSTDSEGEIIYTLDGSDPEVENINGKTYSYKNHYPENQEDPFGELISGTIKSFYYQEPIKIKDRSDEADRLTQISSTFHSNPYYFPENPVFKGTVVKARVVKPGALPSEVITNTYFIDPNKERRYSLPVISLTVQEDALFDYEKGIYVAGKDFDEWRKANSLEEANGGRPANYHRTGKEWEYPAYFEYFDGENGRVVSQPVGIRIHGGWSSANPVKSLRLYARNEYGASEINYASFFSDQHANYKRLILRNSGNDWGYTMFRDAAMHSFVKHLNFETQEFQPAILFINSEYWGIHNIRERYDKYYFESKYEIDPDEIDILEGNMGVVEGSVDHYKETIEFIENNDMVESINYDYIQTRIDVNSLIDYYLAEIFLNNNDWPGNNVKFWRCKTDKYLESAPVVMDGRWRWMMYDTDFVGEESRIEKAIRL